MKIALNVKQMVYSYRNAANEEDADALWDAFKILRDYHFITHEEWNRFFGITYKDWLAADPTMED